MSKPLAVKMPCPGVVSEGALAHDMRDYCWSCAPWWAEIYVCPRCSRKLLESGFCRRCRKYAVIPPTAGVIVAAPPKEGK